MQTLRKLSTSFLIIGFFSLGLMIFFPYLSTYLSMLGFSNSHISFIFAATPLLSIVFSPILGTLSDDIGRKKIMTFGLLISIVSLSLFLYLPKSFIFVIALVTLLSIAVIAVEMSILSLTEDRIKNKKRGIFTGIFESIKSIGIIAGPLIGSLIVTFSPLETNFKVGLLIFILLIFATIFLKEDQEIKIEKRATKKDFNFLREIKDFLKDKDLRAVGVLGATANIAHYGRNIFIPLFITQVLHAPLKYVGIFASISISMSIFQFFFGWLCDKYGSKYFIILGTTISAFSYLTIFFVNNITELLMVAAVLSFGSAMWNTSAWTFMSNIAERKNKEGQIIGTYGAVANKGIFLGTILGGFLVQAAGLRIIFVAYAFLLSVGILYAYRHIIRTQTVRREILYEAQEA